MPDTTTTTEPPAPGGSDSLSGFGFATGAYILWGFLPLYLDMLRHVPAAEVVVHRALWSLPFAGAVLLALGRTAELRTALRSPRMFAQAALTAALISLNWGVYVWAIAAGRTLDAALGYYINPLFSVGLGALLLGERLGRAQIVAIALAAAAVALLTWSTGTLPWVALLLMLTWGFYAFFRKTLPIGPNQGFFLEVLLITPFAAGYGLWLWRTGEGHFLAGNPADTWLLIGCGLATAAPLSLYANGAKRIRLATAGMLQYLTPTLIFLIAVFVFHEPLPGVRLAAFALIWVAVAIFMVSTLGAGRTRPVRTG